MTFENLPYIGDIAVPLLFMFNHPILVAYVIISMTGRYSVKLAKIKYETEKQSKDIIKLNKVVDKLKVELNDVNTALKSIDIDVIKNKEKLSKISLESTFKGVTRL